MNNNIYINNINKRQNKSSCSKLCEVVPLFIKTLILITTALYIINIFAFNISLYISNIPFYTINKYQIWRIFSTSLMNTGIINIILSLILWVKFGAILENTIGTILYLFIFIINSSFIQIIYSALIAIISLIIGNKNILKLKIDNNNLVINSGIWPYIICELTLLSLSNPNEIIKLFFFPELRARFYPLIVFVIFSLVNNLIIDLEVFCGILYAFIYHFLIKNKLKISKTFIKKIENTKFIKCFIKCGGFISIKENRFSNSDNKRQRAVVINNNITNFSQFTSDTNINTKEIDTMDNSTVDKNIMEQNKKALNETLDIKIQK